MEKKKEMKKKTSKTKDIQIGRFFIKYSWNIENVRNEALAILVYCLHFTIPSVDKVKNNNDQWNEIRAPISSMQI